MMLAAYMLRRPATGGGSSSVLVFDVPYELEEGEPPPSGYTMDWFRPERPTLWRVVSGLRHAAKDEHVEGLVLHIDDIDWGWAKVAEVREALQAFRAEGKPVYASLSGGGEREYLLASAADLVTAPPLSVLQLDGLTASAMFMRGTFEKLDITPNFAHSGTYKSGVEGFTRREMSGPAREAMQALLDDFYADLIDSLSVARDLEPDTVARALDEGPYGAEDAWTRGLVDTVMYRADLDSMALNGDDGEKNRVSFLRYLDRPSNSGAHSRIALVVASGAIADGRSREAPGEGTVLGSETLIKALHDACDRGSVKAIVLRIDSPGGSAPASDEIWREVERCREQKPVVASMSDLAASGGYYIAVGADSIVAHPSTITGSIGVFGGKLNILGLYRKLGLNVETLSRGAHAEMLSPYKDFTPDEAAKFQQSMDAVYRTFVSRVADGRGLAAEDVESVAQGHVWSGTAAADRALVDELGGIPRAVEMAKKLAKIPADEEVAIDVYPKVERTFLQRVFSGLFSEDEDDQALAALRLPPVLKAWMTAARFPAGVALTLLPYSIEIH
jgi:protease-4